MLRHRLHVGLLALAVCCVTLCAVCVGLPTTAAAGEEPLTLLVFHMPPYYVLEKGKPAGGFLLDIARKVLEQAGIPYVVREAPPGRVLTILENKTIRACALGWLWTPERENYARFSQPLYENKPVGVVVSSERSRKLGPSPTLKQLMQSGLTWGLRQHFSYGVVIDKVLAHAPRARLCFFPETLTILHLIARHRLDATLIVPEELSVYLAVQPQLARLIRFLPIADAPAGFSRHLMCDTAVGKDTMARIDTAIAIFRKTEQYRMLTRF